MEDIVELLKNKKPAFQIKSGTKEVKASEAFFYQGERDTSSLERTSHAVDMNLIKWILENVEGHHICLETGGGWSTIAFAAKCKKHYCINPDKTANQLIKTFLQENNISQQNVEFITDSSDLCLPSLSFSENIDVALIDGNHSFPYAIIDWHYIDKYLNKDGYILVDDSLIPSVKILSDFLKTAYSYDFHQLIGQCSIFKKNVIHRPIGWSAETTINKDYFSRKNSAT